MDGAISLLAPLLARLRLGHDTLHPMTALAVDLRQGAIDGLVNDLDLFRSQRAVVVFRALEGLVLVLGFGLAGSADLSSRDTLLERIDLWLQDLQLLPIPRFAPGARPWPCN